MDWLKTIGAFLYGILIGVLAPFAGIPLAIYLGENGRKEIETAFWIGYIIGSTFLIRYVLDKINEVQKTLERK